MFGLNFGLTGLNHLCVCVCVCVGLYKLMFYEYNGIYMLHALLQCAVIYFNDHTMSWP